MSKLRLHTKRKWKKATRPLNFILGLITAMSLVLIFGTLTLLSIAQPYKQSQDIRHQAYETNNCDNIFEIPVSECQALEKIYQSTGGSNWRVARGETAWFSNNLPCSWTGIKCNNNDPRLDIVRNRHIIAIGLTDRNLTGQLPRVFTQLPLLDAIDANQNQLTGGLNSLDLLQHPTLKYINLSNNQISGTLNQQFHTNQKLHTLKFANNRLMGQLPSSLGLIESLRVIDFSNNSLAGIIPTSYQNLPLETLLASGNTLCLPKSMHVWYQKIIQTDSLPICDDQPIATPTNIIGTRFTPTPTNTPIPQSTLTPSPTSPKAVVSPTPSSPSKSTKSECNQSCETNNDCANNLRCTTVSGARICRLATNTNDQYCGNPPDRGLNFTCNQYCSDNSECADGLLCWYNRCRQPENVTSLSCLPPASELRAQMDRSCNTSCSSNRDCSLNLRCYQGACRLATYPQSSNCRAPSSTTNHSNDGSTPSKPTPPAKGENLPTPTSNSASIEAELTDDLDATSSALVTPIISPTPTFNPGLVLSPTLAPSQDETAGDTMIGIISTWFQQFFRSVTSSRLPLYLLAGLGIIFLILGLITGRKSKSVDKRFSTPKNPDQAPSNVSQGADGMMNKIQQKGILIPQANQANRTQDDNQ